MDAHGLYDQTFFESAAMILTLITVRNPGSPFQGKNHRRPEKSHEAGAENSRGDPQRQETTVPPLSRYEKGMSSVVRPGENTRSTGLFWKAPVR